MIDPWRSQRGRMSDRPTPRPKDKVAAQAGADYDRGFREGLYEAAALCRKWAADGAAKGLYLSMAETERRVAAALSSEADNLRPDKLGDDS